MTSSDETRPTPQASEGETQPQAPVPPTPTTAEGTPDLPADAPAVAASPAAAPAPAQPIGWPPATAPVPVAAAKPPRGAWIRALTPVTAGVLSGLLLLAGFGIGVVVGWQHDGGQDRRGPVGFNQRDMREGMQPGQRGFGPGHVGPGFGRGNGQGQPGQQGGQQSQPGQQGQPGQQPNLPTRPQQIPTPSPTTTS